MTKYWEERYSKGKTSGAGSIGLHRQYKWTVINSYTKVSSVNDLGCGDLSFWEGRTCNDYMGIDISPTIIEINKKKRSQWSFLCLDLGSKIVIPIKPVVFAMDILFHIMDTVKFEIFLHNCCESSSEFIFMSNWTKRPLNLKDNDIYQFYRSLDEYFEVFHSYNFNLVGKEENPYDCEVGHSVSALYIWKKI